MNQLRKHTQKSIWSYIRILFLRLSFVSISKDVIIGKRVQMLRFPSKIKIDESVFIKDNSILCVCNSQASIKIGERTTIGYNSIIFSSSSIEIGKDCMIAPNAYLVDSDHGMERGINMNIQHNNSLPIVIGDDVWVGANVVILKGVKIGSGAVIAAGSVLRSCVGPNEIWGGVPAKKISNRV